VIILVGKEKREANVKLPYFGRVVAWMGGLGDRNGRTFLERVSALGQTKYVLKH
jgi:hypothetical protein